MIEGVSPDLPHTDPLPASNEWVLRLTRPLVRLGLRLGWRVKVHGAQQVPMPRRGPQPASVLLVGSRKVDT